MFPKLISIGSFFLPTYGLLVALGFLAGIWLTTRLARRAGIDPEKVSNLAIYCALTGLAGAKLLMFVMDFDYYAKNPGRIFSFDTLLSAGVYYGGFLASFLFAWLYIKRQNLPWLKTADVFAPGVALGHAIGRLGCFAAGCCWGSLCDRPWAVTFENPAAHDLTGVPLGIPLHPAQLYEAAVVALLAAFLYRQSGKPHRDGQILGLYLLLYAVARVTIEFFRFHEQALPWGGPFTWTQWIAIGLGAAGAGLVLRSRSQTIVLPAAR
ncbi:prolipoprotein diacylglyceryl transferase [uncultured Paludibaculum sp.]|uniref:prolipoprotein diacylglyceryl transferase n=1 Tax=uncultured Paludibaculum sp. TaxID=1765020 RepID=UPI002AABDC42|nr:prolipoprotein diacylglyceryl transferase [uncultured Paludibaculum sp.]